MTKYLLIIISLLISYISFQQHTIYKIKIEISENTLRKQKEVIEIEEEYNIKYKDNLKKYHQSINKSNNKLDIKSKEEYFNKINKLYEENFINNN